MTAGRTALAIAAAGLLATCLLTTGGCATRKPLYDWGHYEALLYQMYGKPGTADPATQIARLTEDIQKADDAGRAVPPGVHAHLGYMYYLQGNEAAAVRELEIEKTQFPESTVFVDGMLSRLHQP